MRILITVPSFGRHGGIRVLVAWANYLSQWHEVYILLQKGFKPDWIEVKVPIITKPIKADCIIYSSPHAVSLFNLNIPKKFVFCQMAEHMFRENDKVWQKHCRAFYTAPFPMISISKWNIELFNTEFKRAYPTHYVGNGVDFNDFPISHKPKDGKTILVEGWEPGNPTKDVDHVAPKAAKRLGEDGYHIIAYSSKPLKTMPDVPHEYYESPTTEQLNDLYERATIMLKATKYDARACAPMEAGTKGTITVRAIISGDDDLIDNVNSLRCEYNELSMYFNAKLLLENTELRERLSREIRVHVLENNWPYWIGEINQIITS